MAPSIDYSAFDRREILDFVFYPRKDFSVGPMNALDLKVPVEEGISVSCRFYVNNKTSPSILFFHGNGEVVSDYDGIAPIFNNKGINLLVADYRGYGASGGKPTFATMIADAHAVFQTTRNMFKERGYDRLFVMGRSLGSLSALELASHHREDMPGLIIESGFASPARLLRHLGGFARALGLENFEDAVEAMLRTITVPTLIIHGEYDELIPSFEAEYLFETIGAMDKQLVIIPGAGHNDLMLVGMGQYFKALSDFVSQH